MSNNINPIKCGELATSISVHPFANQPTKAWSMISVKIQSVQVDRLFLDEPIKENKVRFVFISDTHSLLHRMHHDIPNGDILIHAGDFSRVGSIEDIKNFSSFLKAISHKFKHIIVIAGNHELSFDKNCSRYKKKVTSPVDEDPRNYLENCIYLEDSYVELYGLKIYGSPWQPTFGNWAFNVDRGVEILKKWNQIPNDTDILITHGPPLGFGDKLYDGERSGCSELLSTIRERVKPKIHVFGHIHEDHGIWTDGCTTYINASICDFSYKPINPPIIYDIDLPSGITKFSFEKSN